MSRLMIMCGLPSSGKTTRARILSDNNWTVVSPDDFRWALHGNAFIKQAEPFVWASVELAVRALLKSGNDVIVDATNTTAQRRKQWKQVADEFGIHLEVLYMTTSYDECVKRIYMQDKEDTMLDVLDRMYTSFEPPDPQSEGCIVYERN